MIFRIKHEWRRALFMAVVGAGFAAILGVSETVETSEFGVAAQIGVGIAGGLVALAINGALHELFKRLHGRAYLDGFERHARDVLGPMRRREFVTGGLMAAFAEEPFFRGVMLVPFAERPATGVAVAAVVFAICHWQRLEHLPFWIWAVWEGILFGILMVTTGSILVPMIAHGLHDTAAYWTLSWLTRSTSESKR